MYNKDKLQQHILGMSVSEDWAEAVEEWSVESCDTSDQEDCPCGHTPIHNLCWIRNRYTNNITFVGNVCIKQFMGIDCSGYVEGFKRIQDDNTKAMNSAAIEFAKLKGWVSDWEYNFLLNTRRKRKLSEAQLSKRVNINNKVIYAMRRCNAEFERESQIKASDNV